MEGIAGDCQAGIVRVMTWREKGYNDGQKNREM